MERLEIPPGVEFLMDDADIDREVVAIRRAMVAPFVPSPELRRLVAEQARRGVDRALRAA